MELNGSRVLREIEGAIQRRCTKCKEWKTSEFFCPSYWNNGGPCRLCAAKTKSEWRKNNNERYKVNNTLYQKNYYNTNKDTIKRKKSDYYKNHRNESRANALLNYAVSCGAITRPDNCSICGISGVTIMGHHDDYSKPLEVKWVCQSCHQYIDKRQYQLKKNVSIPNPRALTKHLREARRLLGELAAYMGMYPSYLEIQKFLQVSCGKGCREILVLNL